MNKNCELINQVNLVILSSNCPVDMDLALNYLGGSRETFEVFRNDFIIQNRQSPEIFITYLQENDYESIEKLAHRIKGTSLYLGSKELYDLTNYIVNQIRSGNNKLTEEVNVLAKFISYLISYLER